MYIYYFFCAATSVSVTPMPYITLGVTDGVDTLSVPSDDDAVSAAVRVPMGFPLGNVTHTAAYVSSSPFGRHTGYMKLFIN